MPYNIKKLVYVLNNVFSVNNNDLRTLFYIKFIYGKPHICKQEIVHDLFINEITYSRISSCVNDNKIPMSIFLAYMEDDINNNMCYKEIVL